MTKPPIKNPALRTWDALNTALRDCDEEFAEKLMKEEMAGRRRKMFVLRIQSRLNKLRSAKALNQVRSKLS